MDYTKTPRLYVTDDLSNNDISLSRDHAHYLINVMRKDDGDMVRIFNGRDGEFISKISIINKKNVELKWLEKIKDQPVLGKNIHLYCAPIKKDRFAFMIEKAVELGVTNIHPITTDHTQNAKINPDKIEKQIIEAAEQCERMDIPTLHPVQKLSQCQFECDTYAGIERAEIAKFQIQTSADIAVIIGPEGGWSDSEINYLSNHKNITAVSLGDIILRAETAAIFMLSRIE